MTAPNHLKHLFDANYYAHGCGSPYQRNEQWLALFGGIAGHIIERIKPTTVLDAGCALGFLVESLRDRGIEAYGVDISDYAIQQVRTDIQPFCRVGSVLEPFGQQYDLITCIEVLEHMPQAEAERAVKNICRHTDDVIFSSSPSDYKEVTHFNVQPPEYWAELFAREGFYHDVDFDASFITPWTIRFRRGRGPVSRVIATYERRLWQLRQENIARRELGLEQRHELAQQEYKLIEQSKQMARWEAQWTELQRSPGWGMLTKLQQGRARLFPPKSVRDQCLDDLLRAWHSRSLEPLGRMLHRIRLDLAQRSKVYGWRARLLMTPLHRGREIDIEEVGQHPPVRPHQAEVDIVICVHNALADVQRCLASVMQHTTAPYRLILVDDGSDPPTRDYLQEFAAKQPCVLLRNEQGTGYTFAANRGLRQTTGDYVVLLNSDTIVTPAWLDHMVDCAESDPRIGLVGPLSNTASWQSIPEFETNGDWAENPLPEGLTSEEMGQLVAHYAARAYPPIPFLNGFCLMIRRQTLQEVGYFDEAQFGAGYGEENDYALRAQQAGWRLALADNAYVYHAQSKSYSHQRRQALSERANTALINKHGEQTVQAGVTACRNDRVLAGIRARSRAMLERRAWIERGWAAFEGRRVLFVLPIFRPGGGANIVFDEAAAMRRMGVDARIFNLSVYRRSFEYSYPGLEIPVLFGEEKHLTALAAEYDAIVATFHASVGWLEPISNFKKKPALGYYIQDFEPYMYAPQGAGYQAAWASYQLIPDMIRFTKTDWTRQELQERVGVTAQVIGVSANIDLFRPRPRPCPEWPERPLRVAAMVRADSPHRAPGLTMEVLRKASQRYRSGLEINIFGTELVDPAFAKLPRNFAWNLAGVLNQRQTANLLNEADIFVDFSSHQAMGLTALEAMACGAAVVVPQQGGATSFARHEANSLVIDTGTFESCWAALQRLIEDHSLRARLQQQAMRDVCQFYPERPAYNILCTLLGSKDAKQQ